MDEICNAFLGPEVRGKYVFKEKPKKGLNSKQTKASTTEKQPENSRTQQENRLTQKCGINNALICRKTTPTTATLSLPNTSPSPTIGSSQPRSKPQKTFKPTIKSKSKSRRPNKKNSRPAKQNQISKGQRIKKEQSR